MTFNDAKLDNKRHDRIVEVQNVVEVNIAKQRNGPVGTVELYCDIGCNVFRNRPERPRR